MQGKETTFDTTMTKQYISHWEAKEISTSKEDIPPI